MTTACFGRDGVHFIPQRSAQGGWGESVSGHAVGGLLGWAAEREVADDGMTPARLTVDLFRATGFRPIELNTHVLHAGKRVKLVETSLMQQDEMVARAIALFVRPSTQPTGDVWSEPVSMPPVPTDAEVQRADLFVRTYGWGTAELRPDLHWQSEEGAKFAWLRLEQPLVDGEQLSAFTRASMAADVTAAVANWGSEGLQFINVDYTLSLSRLPVGPVLGVGSRSHYSVDGVAAGTATLMDTAGPVGTCVSTAVAHSGFRPEQR